MNSDAGMSDIERAKDHEPQLVLSEVARATVHGTDAFGRFNTRLALRIINSVGSMWCAYAFALLAFVSLPAAIASHSTIVLVDWAAQTFLQLALLPIIIVGQNVVTAASDARAAADHATLQAVHRLISEVYATDLQQSEILKRLDGAS